MRDDRLHESHDAGDNDPRSPAEHDRDRILHSDELRRLSGITQVAAGDAGNAVHNRLTHVLEVAQIGQRLAQRLLIKQREIAERVGGVDPSVVEAACLGHDLGHPPFGHIAEEVLNEQADGVNVRDGFEGNAQSFRIVTKLAECREVAEGLNLTRATLNAMLKYPWARGNDGKESRKWGHYSTESNDFSFARKLDPQAGRKSAEAELMDWADDIAYSVNDVEDFYKAGKIPLHLLIQSEDETEAFLSGVHAIWTELKDPRCHRWNDYSDAFKELINLFSVDRPYAGNALQRHALKSQTAVLINRYICAIELVDPAGSSTSFVKIDPDIAKEIAMLKELTWHYVIRDPALATQQHGQRRVIEGLFQVLYDACGSRRKWHILPPRFREIADRMSVDDKDHGSGRFRLVSDMISGLGENQAVALFLRLQGISSGSAFTSLMR